MDCTFKIKTDEIRKIRQQKGLSQEYMATKVGLSQPQYSRVEQGDCTVAYEKVIEIAKVLNVSPNDIIEQSNSFIFNNCNCNQAGNIEKNTIYNNQDFTAILKALLEQTKNIQEQNAELLKIIQSKN